VELLLAKDDVDPDSKDKDGQTPLSRAAEYEHEAVVKLLRRAISLASTMYYALATYSHH
jgi:ankyrin repeat protein